MKQLLFLRLPLCLFAIVISMAALFFDPTVANATGCASLPSAAISWWPAEGNANDIIGGNSGVLSNGVTFAPGMVGQAFSFNGVGSNVQVPDNASLHLTNAFTIELWYKDTGPTGVLYGLIAKRAPYPQGANFGINVDPNAGGVQVFFQDPSYPSYQVSGYLPIPARAVFHHLAATDRQATSEQVETSKLGPRPQTLGSVIQALDAMMLQGQTGTVSVVLDAQGNENAVGFTLSFDPALLTLTTVTVGSGAAIATVDVNTSQAYAGRLGFVLALSSGSSFSPGIHELVKVAFRAAPSASGASLATLGDQLVPREVSDANANPLLATYFDGTITINPPPSLNISRSGPNITLAWPLWATNFVLQQTAELPASLPDWTNLPLIPTITNNQNTIILPLDDSGHFYRLQQQ